MECNHDDDMYLFDPSIGQTPASFPAQSFDDYLNDGTSRSKPAAPAVYTSPTELAMETSIPPPSLTAKAVKIKIEQQKADYRTKLKPSLLEAPEHLSGTQKNHISSLGHPESWQSVLGGLSIPSEDELYANAGTRPHEDYEASNQQMATDFDFDTAASTPSQFVNTTLPNSRHPPTTPFRTSASFNSLAQLKNQSPRLPAGQGHLFFGTSRETSPLHSVLPAATTKFPWAKHSPSSGLEETFNSISMNGDSPSQPRFSPGLQFANNRFNIDPSGSNKTSSTFTKDMSSPSSPATTAESLPTLTVYPTSLKSRVETQIPIRMTLAPLPAGVTKLRLPTYTVSKPKFLAKPEAVRSPDSLELYTSLVCTSAMQDKSKLDRAYARARGEELGPPSNPSPGSPSESHSSKDDEEKPLNGGEVKICSGCIQRERKRASRKKQKKPDEEEEFQKDEEKRVIVFNTSEIKEWIEPAKDTPTGSIGQSTSSPPQQLSKGAMQVDLPMRIACYCRHQNEKLGFQVIFTIKDHTDKVVAQATTNSIMITDDHKTHNVPPTTMGTSNTSHPNTPRLSNNGGFSQPGMDRSNVPAIGPRSFKQSLSTTDLQGLEHNFNPNFPMTSSPNRFTFPSTATPLATTATLIPRNLSRPASPTGVKGPAKRRKQSGSGKIPSGLTMTRLEMSQPTSSPSTVPRTATATSFAPSVMTLTNDRFPTSSRPAAYATSPPTPNGNDNGLMSAVNRSFSMENLTQQAMMSAPSSRHPSRPGSAASKRNSFGADPGANRPGTNQPFANQSRRTPPIIHKLVPSEGSITGGTEVTLYGNGFYQGLEVMFGDVEATTTTFWADKCLNCIAPPALQTGAVSVIFKHEHHQAQPQVRPILFTYVNDREVEMYRLALKTLGKHMHHPTEDPYLAAQRLLGGPSFSGWPAVQGGFVGGGRGHQVAESNVHLTVAND